MPSKSLVAPPEPVDWMEALPSRRWTVALLLVGATSALAFPSVGPVALALGAILASLRLARHAPRPAASRGRGAFFLGNDMRDRREIWLTDEDCRRHSLVVGATGSGKTEALLGTCLNAVGHSSGFAYVDGSGSLSLVETAMCLARASAREDDLLVLNFMGESRHKGGRLFTHTFNPFATGDAQAVARILASVTDPEDVTGLAHAVAAPLVALRDRGLASLNPAALLDALRPPRLAELAAAPEVPEEARDALGRFLSRVPQEDVARQAAAMSSWLAIAASRGSVTDADEPDVSMADVVANRRLLLVILPCLDRNEAHSALGRLVLASMAEALREGVGVASLEGTGSTFHVILDQAERYAVGTRQSFVEAVRGSVVALTFATSHGAGALGREATRFATKRIMRVERPDWAGAAIRVVGTGAEAPVRYLDLKGQENGQAMVVTDDATTRVQCLYANPERALDPNTLQLRLSHLVPLGRQGQGPEDAK